MFFSNKKKSLKCEVCSSKVNEKYSFCPYCGTNLIDEEAELKEFGMLGRSDLKESEIPINPMMNLGITDKLIGSLMNSLMKNLDKQFKEMEKTEIRSFPNGIKIRIGPPVPMQQQKKETQTKKAISSEQLQKMSILPRATAKSNVRRLSNKVVYELNIPGIESPEDVFVSKTESGYEIKVIGNKKVYINNIAIDLPIKGYSIDNNKLLVEFKTEF